jgi:predicted transposase YbfD/YdcC
LGIAILSRKAFRMDSSTDFCGSQSGTLGVVFDVDSLYAEFNGLVDRRERRGRRYSLGTVLLLIVLAKMCGEDRPYGIAQWVSARTAELREILALRSRRLPSLNTYRRVLQSAVDVRELHRAVKRFLYQKGKRGERKLVSIDGKTLRGTLSTRVQRGVHVLAAYLPAQGVVLMQVAVGDKGNELSAAPRLLRSLDLRGNVVMGDAMFTQRELSQQILQAGGDYIWLAKENQQHLQEAIAQLFAPVSRSPGWGVPPNDFQKAMRCDKGHGRLEERVLTCSTLLNDYLDWPGVAQVFQLQRHRTNLCNGACTTQTVYGLTSLNRSQAPAPQLLSLVRDYWRIENSLFHRRDATLREDATHTMASSLAQALSAINNLVIGLTLRNGWPSLPEARRHFDAHPTAALGLLLQSG